MTNEQIGDAIVRLLRDRDPASTICPSEAARALAPDAWRPLMPRVREVAVALAKTGALDIRQGGRTVSPGGSLRGPIRLAMATAHPTTPDGRYFVVRERLWRKSNPNLSADVRDRLVKELMAARSGLRGKRSDAERAAAREQVDAAKRALGERGPVWWTDGAPDFNRKLVKNTPYGGWFSSL